MKLALDIGNSRTKWGLFTDDGWVDKGSWETAQWAQLTHLLQQHTPMQVMAAHVASNDVKVGITQCCATAHVPLQWVNPNTPTPLLRSRYDAEQLGADRWAALIGAHTFTQKNAVVVNAGTATTVDALSAEGEFLGGVILPGLTLMAAALAQGTAQLPHAQGQFTTLPVNTMDAITSGAILATVGAIERMAAALHERTQQPVICLLSGGAQEVLITRLNLPVLAVENLVLEGVARLMAD
jgi:type III pantothenate kinase